MNSKWCILICCLPFACEQRIEWQQVINASGTFSSPRSVNLNEDGVKDIVFGAGGRREWESSENGVIALDGANGSVLWKKDCRNQIVGSPAFNDITGDGISDVFIGGRSAQFMALDGKNGQLIWEHLPTDPNHDYQTDTTILNFFNPQFISDRDNDGLNDILVSYGGFVEARPNNYNRPVGYLMIFSAKTGKMISKTPMPDGKEIYMSPVIISEDGIEKVLFGTGGETIPGSLYLASVDDLMDQLLSDHNTLCSGKYKGLIAPPMLAEITGDNKVDIILNCFEGKVIALDGDGFDLIWEIDLGREYESHSQPAAGNFTGDSTLDFFVNYGKGSWPEMYGAIQLIIDGKTGEVTVVDSIGYLQYSSPITIQSSPGDQVLLPVNDLHPTSFPLESGKPSHAYENLVYMFDIRQRSKEIIYSNEGTNIGSTILMDDLDSNGMQELVYVYNLNPYDPFEHSGFLISCRTVPFRSNHWNQYMGQDGRSVFENF